MSNRFVHEQVCLGERVAGQIDYISRQAATGRSLLDPQFRHRPESGPRSIRTLQRPGLGTRGWEADDGFRAPTVLVR